MAWVLEAFKSFDDTRATLEGTLKSGNKRYEESNSGVKTFLRGAVSLGQWQWQPTPKQARRNQNYVLANTELPAIRQLYQGMTPFQAGNTLVIRRRQNGNTFAANCGEQAAMAIYFAHNDYQVPLTNMWEYTLTGQQSGFAHSFALFTDNIYNQGVGNVPALANVNGVIVDPWMNLVCFPKDYDRDARLKLEGWDKAEKRLAIIRGGGNNGQADWVDATDSRIAEFLSGAVTGRRADEH
jgi:hypothetical protein